MKKKRLENGPSAEKITRTEEQEDWAEKRERERERGETGRGNQMTALRFQTVGKTSDIPGLPSGVREVKT